MVDRRANGFFGIVKGRNSDLVVAGSVIVCSVVLLIALAMGLSGRSLIEGGRTVKVRFHDMTGVKVSSLVKYAGAPAGTVSAVRILTEQERVGDQRNLVEVTLRIHPDVPPLDSGTKVSIAADTILSDKFILISDGAPGAAPLGDGDVIQGIAPTTFDELIGNANGAIEGLRRTLSGDAAGDTDDLFKRAGKVVGDLEALLTSIKPVVGEAHGLVAEAREAASQVKGLVEQNRKTITDTVTKLHSASSDLESFAGRADRLVRDTERPLVTTLGDFKITVENLKVTSTYAKFLLNDLAERPSRLIWGGGKAPTLPSERRILESRKPVPVE